MNRLLQLLKHKLDIITEDAPEAMFHPKMLQMLDELEGQPAEPDKTDDSKSGTD